MNRIKKKKILDNDEEDDYIINNDQEIEDFQNNNQNSNNMKNQSYKNEISLTKEQNKKSPKGPQRSAAEWIKEAKQKYQQEKNNNKNNINKTESKKSIGSKKANKKIINYDDVPVGGGIGGGANFNIEIKVPTKKNNFTENNNNYEDKYQKEVYLKKKLDNKMNIQKSNVNNNKYEDKNINNEQGELERKNSLVSMVTQTCDREMVGRSEFIGIPVDHNNLNPSLSREIILDPNMIRLAETKQSYSLYDKNNANFKDNLDTSNFSSINKITDFSTTQNLREKTENVIQLQNVQRELDNEIEMNKRLQGQIENYKGEFNNLREELVKKSDVINELQQKISKLEKELFLQGNQLIEAESKPSQEHYEDIVNNYEEMKKNFDKAIERIKFLSDENAELKEKNLRLEENNKKLRKELKLNKDKLIYQGENKNNIKKNNNRFDDKEEEYQEENGNDYYNDSNENNEELDDINDDFNNEIQNKKTNNNKQKKIENNNIDNYINKVNNNENEKINKEQTTNENTKEIPEKRSIIPEDNDIFGTRSIPNSSKNVKKPRKIQEDGIPVIKRVEEKDNVKDIMINNYATNDDDYYNRPPVGKPKARRIKRGTNNYLNNNLNNLGEPKTKDEIEKNNYDLKENEIKNSINENEENNYNNNYYNNKNNFQKFSKNNKENVIQRNTKGNITTSVGVFPSQLKSIVNEREILNLESKLFNLQKERDLINDEYLKFPEYPKKREEINAKRKIEIKLEEMNKEISLQKLKIRELKEQK